VTGKCRHCTALFPNVSCSRRYNSIQADTKPAPTRLFRDVPTRDNTRMEQGAHILIVDDDHDIRSLLADYLEGHGYRTSTAAEGTAMENALQHGDIDLVVLDLNLPGEDGMTLCRKLRARSALPVIMLTARSDPLDRILGL